MTLDFYIQQNQNFLRTTFIEANRISWTIHFENILENMGLDKFLIYF